MQVSSETSVRPHPPQGLSEATIVGAGRHGTVFHGWLHNTEVAVKVPPCPEVGTREAAALQHLRHPNVVDLVADAPEGTGLVMEYCAGGTLADRVDGTPRCISEAAELMAPILAAVAHIHRSGWVHGDISPSNIGIRASGEPVLLDFAASRPADGSRIIEGTVDYAGPLRAAEPALDVRSCAVVTLELLGPPNRWDDATSTARSRIEDLIRNADAGAAASVQDLTAILFGVSQPGDKRSGTVEFGPRPPSPGASGSAVQPSPRDRRWSPAVLVAVVALFTFFISSEVMASASITDPAVVVPSSAVQRIVAAEATLAGAGVSWSSATGSLRSVDGSDERWNVGEPGDLAAVGRWRCTEDATLGVYRPSTGEWFVFPSWLDDASSSAPLTLPAFGTELMVESTDDCDRPVVQD